MDDAADSRDATYPPTNVAPDLIEPVPVQPPGQLHQDANPKQFFQTRTVDQPENKALGDPITPATTIDDLIKRAFFIADSIDQPQIDAISLTHINLYYPADGSMISLRVEARPGMWRGISPILMDDEQKAAANAYYDERLAASQPPAPPPEGEAQAGDRDYGRPYGSDRESLAVHGPPEEVRQPEYAS